MRLQDQIGDFCRSSLISVAAPRSKKIERDKYLKYQISAYLQEVYILKERLISYATKLQRAYKATTKSEQFERAVRPLCEMVSESFKGLVDTRGEHVHASRFSDQYLDLLSRLHFLSRFKEELAEDAKWEYWFVRREWGERVKNNNVQTMKLLDSYFDVMYKLVTHQGVVVNPEGHK